MIKNLASFNDRIGFVVLSAPSKFPKIGPFTDDQKRNLEIAFDEMKQGMVLVAKKIKDSERMKQLEKILEDSLAAYRVGDKIKGAHLLQDFQDIVFPDSFKEYEARKG